MTYLVTAGVALGLFALIALTQFRWIPNSSWVAGRPYSRWRINAILVLVTFIASLVAALIEHAASESAAAWAWAVFAGMLVATLLVLAVEVVLWIIRHWQWAIVIGIFVIGGSAYAYFNLPGLREFIGTLHGG